MIYFRRIPRNASTTFQHLADKNILPITILKDEIPMSEYWKKLPKDAKVFGVVRVPYNRVQSMFSWFRSPENMGMTVDDFVKYMLKNRKGFNEQQKWHTEPQYPYIDTSIELLRFDHLQADFDRLCDKWGINDRIKLPHLNNSKRVPSNQKFWFREDSSNKSIEKIYKCDFDNLMPGVKNFRTVSIKEFIDMVINNEGYPSYETKKTINKIKTKNDAILYKKDNEPAVRNICQCILRGVCYFYKENVLIDVD